jgi:hypothetical protein
MIQQRNGKLSKDDFAGTCKVELTAGEMLNILARGEKKELIISK